MAWYDDPSKTTFVGTYANEKQLVWDADAATKRGWTIQPAAPEEEELVIGAPTKSKITVTFVRREDWLQNRKLEIATSMRESAAQAADEKEAKHVKAADELGRAEEAFAARVEAVATASDALREQAEKDVLSALKDVIARRKDALRAKDEAIKEMDAAVSVGASEFARSMSLLTREREVEAGRLEAELALLASQEQVTRAARDWRDSGDRRLAAEEQLARRVADFELKDAALIERIHARDQLLAALRPAVR
ncbi:MAG: hypothetical protein AB7N24_20880 [Dehalococcoidia bacterium]